jgi:hypothetical protein
MRNPGETDIEQAETAKRVSQLRAERAGIQAELGMLLARDAKPPQIPSASEVREELTRLSEILSAACRVPGGEEEGLARELVKLLTGGTIEVVQMGEAQKGKGWVRGTFSCPLVEVVAERLGGAPVLRSSRRQS